MTDFDNKLNLGNVHSSYAPKHKKQGKASSCTPDDGICENINEQNTQKGSEAAAAYNRILVKPTSKTETPEMIQGVKDAMEFFMQNPELAAAAVRSADDALELLEAQGTEDAYEKACCGACDAAYDRV